MVMRRTARYAAALAIGCQLLVPAGYMPGRIADGTPFVLCRMNMAALGPAAAARHAPSRAMHDAAAMHRSAGDHTAAGETQPDPHRDHSGSAAWEHCPLGALSASAALAFTIAPAIAPAVPDRISTQVAIRLLAAARVPARARAPPAAVLPYFV